MTKTNHKLRAVIRHEFLTIVRQPSFWIALVALPLLIAVIVAIGYFTDSSQESDIHPRNNTRDIAVIDESGLIVPDLAASYKVRIEESGRSNQLQQAVQTGDLDGLIVYPADITQSGTYLMYANNTDSTDNAAAVREIGRALLQQSLLTPLESPELANLALTGGDGKLEAYKDGEPEKGFTDYVVPGSFLALFYIVLVFSIGYALTSVSEEKENRSIEMVLSYVKPQTLIIGKLLAVILVTLTQIIFFLLLGLAAYFVARALGNDLSLPFNLSDITFEPSAILFGIAFLVFGFIFFVSLMATIGAIFPSTKEASSFSTVFYLLPALPFWGFSALTDNPSGAFSQFVTYFPLSSPTASLIRNMFGNLSIMEGLLSLAILAASTAITILLAGKAFRLGTLEYNSRVKFSSLFKK